MAEVYCPKCKQTFEEGSRRFCPTDGVRLLSDAFDADDATAGGIFANLIPKIDAISDLGEKHEVPPAARPAPPRPAYDPSEIREPALPDVLLRPSAPEPTPPRPAARKVNPYEIPAGHVDLADHDRPLPPGADFDPHDPEDFVGKVVKGRYKVTEFLGGDETGVSYLADDKIVNDKLVLVRILPESRLDEMMKSILAEERIALSHFSHPNVARLIDSGAFTNGIQFLISEYTDALSIRDVLSIHGRVDPERAARIIKQAANGLSEAHQEGILHRDIRPENLILSSEQEADHVKLVNFGASDGSPNEFNAAYKAPEVLEGRSTTAASDIFSLAIVAYEMLTGKLPFNGESQKAISRAQMAGLLHKPSDVVGLAVTADEVFSKALSFNPAGRFTKAREFGDAAATALAGMSPSPVEAAAPRVTQSVRAASVTQDPPAQPVAKTVKLTPAAPAGATGEPAWTRRSPEPPEITNSKLKLIGFVSIGALVVMLLGGWWWVKTHPAEPTLIPNGPANATDNPTISSDIEVPPLARKIQQPQNTNFYQNTKANLKGDLLRHFVGFSMYYPKDWKANGPAPGPDATSRGKFLDISRVAADGRMKEQMLISYYTSKGTFKDDAEKFSQMVKETNETLKKILPGYQLVSEGEIKVNGDWRAYEVKFQGGGTSDSGEKLIVWGRRLFMPAARPGTQNGFEITMLATSLADDVKSVDDVGVKGELAAVLYSFEPSQDF